MYKRCLNAKQFAHGANAHFPEGRGSGAPNEAGHPIWMWGYFVFAFSAGVVTMLTFVMPACFTASMSVAKAPKETA